MLQVSKNASRCCNEPSKSYARLQEAANKSAEESDGLGVKNSTKFPNGTLEHKQGRERPSNLLENARTQCPSGNSKHELHENHDIVDNRNLDMKDGEGSGLDTYSTESCGLELCAMLSNTQFQDHGYNKSDKSEIGNVQAQEKIANYEMVLKANSK